jgi:hypothetical protein
MAKKRNMKNSGKGSDLGKYAPSTTADKMDTEVANTKEKKPVRGPKIASMNITKTRTQQRVSYPHLLVADVNSCKESILSGLSPSWLATFVNIESGSGLSHSEAVAEYNFKTDATSRNQLCTRLGAQRPLSTRAMGRTGVMDRNGQGGLAAVLTHDDAAIAWYEYHREFSREVGKFVKFQQMAIEVSRLAIGTRGHQYSVLPGSKKANGSFLAPFEKLYDELYLHYNLDDLNIPADRRANLTLRIWRYIHWNL